MKNRFIVVYTVFAAAVFIFALSFFGFNLYKEYTSNQNKSETRYTNLVNDIRTLSYNQSENNSAYIKAIKDAIGDTSFYSFIQIKRDGETLVFYPAGKMKEETVSNLTKSFTSSLTVNKKNISVDCNLYLIRPDSIFYFARVSFLMILIITIITVIMIIYLNMAEEASSDVISLEEDDEIKDIEKSEVSEAEEEIKTEKTADEEETIEVEKEDKEEVSDDANAEKAEPVIQNENEIEESSDSVEEKSSEVTAEEVKAIFAEPLTDASVEAEESIEDAIPLENPAAEKNAKLPVDEIKPAKIEDNPSGLFDPATGIGWESYLFTRLNNEIERATASEIDISLFVIKVPEIEMTSDVYKNICNYLAIQFQFKDLLFEYKSDSIVAIKISMNIDEALILADKLYSDICNIINGSNCRIGITSRSIRMVTGERLMLEAEQSIEHTDTDSPIIAFRVDSEKYRRMMEQN